MDYRKLAASLAASLAAAAASSAIAATAPAGDSSRIISQYSTWAGSRANSEALVQGLRHGSTITLVTTAPDRTMSLAGFTPAAAMSDAEISHALGAAQRTLTRHGIAHPTAEQIQAALIGGDLATANGRTQRVAGVVATRGGSRIASR
jgi:hypothetical protein